MPDHSTQHKNTGCVFTREYLRSQVLRGIKLARARKDKSTVNFGLRLVAALDREAA